MTSLNFAIVATCCLALMGTYPARTLADGASEVAALLNQAEAGSEAATLALGDRYFYGNGAPKSLFEAHIWYSIAAQRGSPEGRSLQEHTARQLREAQRIRAARHVRWWLAHHASRAAERRDLAEDEPARHRSGSGERFPSERADAGGDVAGVSVLKVQVALDKLGFTPGPLDGMLGTQTRRAIREYQREFGLQEDGQVSRALALHLEDQVSDQIIPPDRVTRTEQASEPDQPAGPVTYTTTSREAGSDVALVQEALLLLGFAPGPVDGVLGPQTRNAIEEYQRRNDLPIDGQLSIALMDDLREELLSARERMAYRR